MATKGGGISTGKIISTYQRPELHEVTKDRFFLVVEETGKAKRSGSGGSSRYGPYHKRGGAVSRRRI